jgi:uncharacterized DUF497 family protein
MLHLEHPETSKMARTDNLRQESMRQRWVATGSSSTQATSVHSPTLFMRRGRKPSIVRIVSFRDTTEQSMRYSMPRLHSCSIHESVQLWMHMDAARFPAMRLGRRTRFTSQGAR